MKRKFFATTFLMIVSAILLVMPGIHASAEPIIIDDCSSGVENQMLDDGSSMAELITACAEDANNHGEFVSCVSHLTNTWKKEGLINGREKGGIQRCAASANIPPGCEVDSDCDDGIYCNGEEVCNDTVCQPGTTIACPDDGLFCNGSESCDEMRDACVNSGDPCIAPAVCNEDTDICGCGSNAECDDGLFCTGLETCVGGVCQPGTPAGCPDNGAFCDGTEYCDENGDVCASTGNPCPPGTVCNDASDGCDPEVVCGNGIVEAGEECDDGNTAGGDCCSASCTFEEAGSLCPDNVYCNGVELCDGGGVCLETAPVDCSDGVNCTIDACDEAADSCVHTPESGYCDNGQYCDGLEVCDAVGDCQPGTPVECPDNGAFCDGTEYCDENGDACGSSGDPCGPGYVCNEISDSCDPVIVCECGDGQVCGNEQCDDGNRVSGDCCSEACIFEAEGSPCSDDVYCNGAESCDNAGVCLSGTAVECSDGVACTDDACNEVTDRCDSIPNNNLCDNGQYCDGLEVCDAVSDCQPGTPVECPDNSAFCDGTEYCDENGDVCASTGNPCPPGTVCNDASDGCDPEVVCGNGIVEAGEECDDGNTAGGDCCSGACTYEQAGSPCPDNVYCNGVELCDGGGVCLETAPVDCNDGVRCTIDACDETADICVHELDNSYCDDRLFCTGIEVCDPVADCQPGTPVECPDNGAFCDGVEYCDDITGSCISEGDPCGPLTICNEETDMCESEFAAAFKRFLYQLRQAQ